MEINQRKISHHYALLFVLIFFGSFPAATTFAAAPTWQGPYIGAYIGGGLANNHAVTNVGSVTGTSYFTTAADINAINNAGTYTNSPSSMIAGIQAGHDWAWNKMVYGIAFDYGALPLSSSKGVYNSTYPDNTNQYSVYTSISTNWLFTLRGRVGYQTDLHWPGLLYLTGGMAMTQLKVNNSFSDNSSIAGSGGNNTAENQIGWTAGAGLELASFDHATIDIEYQYIHVPSVKVTSSILNTSGGFGIPAQSLGNPFTTTGNFHANLIKIGLNYRFDE